MPRYDRYTPDAITLLQETQRRAFSSPSKEMTPALLLEAFLLGTSELRRHFLESADLKLIAAQETEAVADAPSGAELKQVVLSSDLRGDLDEAEASTPGQVTAWHVLSAIWPEVQCKLTELVRRNGQPVAGPVDLPQLPPAEPAATPPNPKKLSPLGGPLGQLGRELTESVSAHPIVGRDREMNELMAILLKYHKPNALLLGDAGVGKTAIVEGLDQRIREGNVPPGLRDKRIVEIPVGAMVAGTRYRGDFEKRMTAIIAQAESDDRIILFIDEIHMLVGAGVNSGDQGDAADILKPALARGRMRVIGATTWSEYYESIEQDPALKRRFQEVRIDEPSDEIVAAILAGAMPPMLAHHAVEAAPDIVPLVISLCRSELPSRRFPDKAIDVVDRACAQAALAGMKSLAPEHIRGVIAELAGIEFTTDSPEFKNRLATLEDALKRNVLRQDEAIHAVARTVRLCKQRLDLRTHRPDGVFLFVGKSGVGKTALAHTLAKTLLGRDDAVIRLDMTSYSDPHCINSLLGSPPGLIGSNEEPAWLEQLKKTPSAVLLLDELEKAHPNVMKVFLRAFDEGGITDARGNEYSLANVTVIATSNAHVDTEGGGFGFHASERDEHQAWVNGLQDYFLPEFLNRFDEIVPFDPLSVADLGIIVREKLMPQAERKLRQECNVRLSITDAAIRRLAEMADSENFGARELERVFRNEVLIPAADAALAVKNANQPSAGVVEVDKAADGCLSVVLRMTAA